MEVYHLEVVYMAHLLVVTGVAQLPAMRLTQQVVVKEVGLLEAFPEEGLAVHKVALMLVGLPRLASFLQSPAGSRGSQSPAGSRGSQSPAGRQGSHSPAGSYTSRSPAGSRASHSPAGSRASRSPAGSRASRSPASSHASRSPAGSRASRSPAGSRASRSPAGSRASRSPAGISRSPAGSRVSRSPAGSRASRSPAGSRASRSPAGSRVSRSPAGSRGSLSPVSRKDGDDSPAKNHKLSDGESGAGSPSRKRKSHDLSDDSDSSTTKKSRVENDVKTDDLFGDADDISDVDDGPSDEEGGTEKPPRRSHVISDDEDDVRRGSDLERDVRSRSRSPQPDEENEAGDGAAAAEEEEEAVIPETKIEAEIPKINTDLGRQIHFVKLPNFLSVERRPFDHETYEDEIDEEETLDEEGRARLKLKVENTIRWRLNFDNEGNAIRESNAKLVRWSDGSLSLHLGSEIFDVYKQPLQGDHNHLFIRQGTGLQGQAVFRTKLSFRPHSTDSFTHRKILSSLAERSLKTSAVKVLSQVIKDPDTKRNELFKRDEDRLRASLRRASKQKRVKERAPAKGLTKGYLEEEEDEENGSFSISAIKNQHKKKMKEPSSIYSDSDSDLSDLGASKSKKGGKRQTLTDYSDDDNDDDDDESAGSSGSGASDAGSPKSKKSKNSSGSDSEDKSNQSEEDSE
ncbi:Leo1-like protein [Trinorchestia longiramus]|nr:Leo1-like protein [Trinorchestia longiramus]